MLPENLENQLRFNLDVPYNINKLSVRHRHPQPIIIEKEPKPVSQRVAHETESQLTTQFNTLSLEKLKQAQFLAQRQLKKAKDAKILESNSTEAARKSEVKIIESPQKKSQTKGLRTRSKPNLVNKSTKAIQKRQSLKDLPVTGNSPPVRDVSGPRVPTSNVVRVRRNLDKDLTDTNSATNPILSNLSTDNPQSLSTEKQLKQGKHSSIVKEKLDTKSMPDLHLMAMEELTRVGDRRSHQRAMVRRPNKDTPTKSSVLKSKPRQPQKRLCHQQIRPYLNRINDRVSQQIKKQPTKPQQPRAYQGSRYGYGEPDSRRQMYDTTNKDLPPPQYELPDLDHFVDRIFEARRQKKVAEQLRADPKAVVDQIERDARERLEPLIRRAETLSQTLMTEAWKNSSGDTKDKQTEKQIDSDEQYRSVEVIGSDRIVEREIEQNREPEIPPADLMVLKSMLHRLDEMEREHIEVRHHWMTARSYEDCLELPETEPIGMQATDIQEMTTVKHEQITPQPMFFTKSKRSKSLQFRPSHHGSNSKKNDSSEKGAEPLILTLPPEHIASVQDGKKQFEHYLDSICHNKIAGFDPWRFAESVANDIVEDCIDEVTKEISEVSNSVIEDLYLEEFIVAPGQVN